jgi:hypothetical protein
VKILRIFILFTVGEWKEGGIRELVLYRKIRVIIEEIPITWISNTIFIINEKNVMSSECLLMADVPCENVSPHEKYDMVDLDSEYEDLEPLTTAIPKFNELLNLKYKEHDEDAIVKQNNRNRYLNSTIRAGTGALILAVFQFLLIAFNIEVSYQLLFAGIEVLTVLFAVYAIYGGYQLFHIRWLLERHKAERLRLLKFRYLINPILWCNNPTNIESWYKKLNEEIDKIENLEEEDIDSWIIESKIEKPPEITGCYYNKNNIAAFLRYYLDKRLNHQKNYYCEKIKTLSKEDKKIPEKLPLRLYLTGVIFVIIHIISAFLYYITNFLLIHDLSFIFLFFAILFPLLGAAISSTRSGLEISRSIRIFKGKYSAIVEFEKKIETQLNEDNLPWKEIGTILWECEKFFEAEHHEWLLLIKNIELHY